MIAVPFPPDRSGPTPQEFPMTVRTRLQPRFLIQRIAMIVICLVLGLWGTYDYLVKIPRAEAMSARSPVYAAALNAIQTSSDAEATRAEIDEAAEAAKLAIEAAIAALPEGIEPQSEIRAQIQPMDDASWAGELAMMADVVATYVTTPKGDELSEGAIAGAEVIRSRSNATGAVTPPTKFDRLTQWFFILCLPFVPWYAFTFVREMRVVHGLEEDGTFVSPGGRWARDEIADIDMSRWMSKSVATVVHQDGRREKMDDYVHRGVEEIVGVIASRLHPEAWTPEAKPVKKAEDAAAPADGEAGGAEEAGEKPAGTAGTPAEAGSTAATEGADDAPTKS
jgi:hypothetical protein